MAQISKFHIGSKIINADTQTDVGTILHDASLKTVNGNSLVGSGDVVVDLSAEFLGSALSASTITIAPSKGLNSVVVFLFTATGVIVPTITSILTDIGTSGSSNRLYQGSIQVCAFRRNTAGTEIIIDSMTIGALSVYELVVA